jgi:hypothetical protein
MMKKMLRYFAIPLDTTNMYWNRLYWTPVQCNLYMTAQICCGRMPDRLKQHHADFLMLELVEQGRI